MYNTDLPNRAELPSSTQLLRSTVLAIVAAAVLLATVVLPSEYAVEPTGIGRVLGLTQMGEIKMQLAAENERAGGNIIRIISARRATKQESQFYGG